MYTVILYLCIYTLRIRTYPSDRYRKVTSCEKDNNFRIVEQHLLFKRVFRTGQQGKNNLARIHSASER